MKLPPPPAPGIDLVTQTNANEKIFALAYMTSSEMGTSLNQATQGFN